MAKASLAPPSIYRRHFYIADHAIEQYRIRGGKGNAQLHRFDGDIGNLLDWTVHNQWDERVTCRDTKDGDHVIHIVDLLPSMDEELWALVKDNEFGDKGNRIPLAVVTVLTREMVEKYQREGRWIASGSRNVVEIVKTKLTSKLADKLQGVTISPAAAPPPAMLTPPASTLRSALPVINAADAHESARLLTYIRDGEFHYGVHQKGVALAMVPALQGDPDVTDVLVWKPVKVKVTVAEED